MSMVCKAWHAAASGQHAGQWWGTPVHPFPMPTFIMRFDDPERAGSFLEWLTRQPAKRLTFTHVNLTVQVQPADLLLEALAAAVPLLHCLTLETTAQCSDTALAMLPMLEKARLVNVELMSFRWVGRVTGAACRCRWVPAAAAGCLPLPLGARSTPTAPWSVPSPCVQAPGHPVGAHQLAAVRRRRQHHRPTASAATRSAHPPSAHRLDALGTAGHRWVLCCVPVLPLGVLPPPAASGLRF
jgi:hypothetical protein